MFGPSGLRHRTHHISAARVRLDVVKLLVEDAIKVGTYALRGVSFQLQLRIPVERRESDALLIIAELDGLKVSTVPPLTTIIG